MHVRRQQRLRTQRPTEKSFPSTPRSVTNTHCNHAPLKIRSLTVQYRVRASCTTCRGDGRTFVSDGDENCPSCNGYGYGGGWDICGGCNGTGTTPINPRTVRCTACHGRGYQIATREGGSLAWVSRLLFIPEPVYYPARIAIRITGQIVLVIFGLALVLACIAFFYFFFTTIPSRF